jgi:hypothetical protein
MADRTVTRKIWVLDRISPERAVAAALVVLLHLLLLWLLLRATITNVVPLAAFRPEAITIWLKPAPEKKKPKPEEKKKPETVPPVTKFSIPFSVPPAAPPASNYNGLRAFGRYLNNCSSGNYEALSSREWAHCLGNQWNAPGEATLTLGPEAPSEWKRQMDKRKKPAKPIEHECAQGSLNSNLGLPCYDFSGQ